MVLRLGADAVFRAVATAVMPKAIKNSLTGRTTRGNGPQVMAPHAVHGVRPGQESDGDLHVNAMFGRQLTHRDKVDTG